MGKTIVPYFGTQKFKRKYFLIYTDSKLTNKYTFIHNKFLTLSKVTSYTNLPMQLKKLRLNEKKTGLEKKFYRQVIKTSWEKMYMAM